MIITKSTKLYFLLIFILALCGASNFYLPLGNFWTADLQD